MSDSGRRRRRLGPHQAGEELLQCQKPDGFVPLLVRRRTEPVRMQAVQQGRQQLKGSCLETPRWRREGFLGVCQRVHQPGHHHMQVGLRPASYLFSMLASLPLAAASRHPLLMPAAVVALSAACVQVALLLTHSQADDQCVEERCLRRYSSL